MDQRTLKSDDGCLVVLNYLTANIRVLLSTEREIIATIKQIERAHWDYLDNYRDKNRRRYPTISIQQFARELFRSRDLHNISTCDIQNYLRIYNRYKKNLPTAGVILYYVDDNDIYFVVVKMRCTKIWSMPKGKKEPTEDLSITARREFREETGIDLEDCLTSETRTRFIHKTRFYLVESDTKSTKFVGYNIREVDDVQWVSAAYVARHPMNYSKQTVSAANYLLECH